MKSRYFAALLCFLFAAGCSTTPPPPPGKLALTRQERPIPIATLDELKETIREFNPVIGKYPPEFDDDDHKRQVYEQWSDAFVDAKTYMLQDGESERVLWTVSELARQGHNMDVEGMGALAQEQIEKCIRRYPESRICNFSAVDFYLSIKVSGESMAGLSRSLTTLRKKIAPKVNYKVEESFIYLYAYDHQPTLAVKQIDYFLGLFPDAKRRDELLKMKAELS